jgi:ABC-2 type transport system permease protein
MPLFLLWLLSWNEAAVGADTVTVMRALSLFDHFQSFSVGVIEVRDVFYFVALIAGFWWATLRVLEARQWRGRR